MPDKHIKFSESLLGLGSYVLDALSAPQTIDDLWEGYGKARKAGAYPASHTFENLVLAVDILFAIGAVTEVEHSGALRRCA
jgi:hypothetical protein